MMRSIRKPPLPRSPIRLRSRQALNPNPNTIDLKTPPGTSKKVQSLKRSGEIEESELRPEYLTISCELRALAKMVEDQCGKSDDDGNVYRALDSNRSPLFERGRFYDEYTARRNERLKRKKGETGGEEKRAVYGLGVRVESAKKSSASKTLKSMRKTAVSTPATVTTTAMRESAIPRYSLRSSACKENKKPPQTPLTAAGARRGRRI